MPRAKSKSAGAAKKQRGRPPKAAAANADAAPKKRLGRPPKDAAKAAQTTPKRGGRPPSAPPAVDGRRIPTSPQTVRAQGAAERAASLLREARQTLVDSQEAAADARAKAKSSGAAGDKNAVKKVRLKVGRAVKKVAALRGALREAKLRVAALKADDRYKAKANTIAVRLRQAELAAQERIETKLDRAVRRFRDGKLTELTKAEAKKAKARKLQAEKSLAGLEKEKEAKIRAAQTALEPKPRKKRRKRRATA